MKGGEKKEIVKWQNTLNTTVEKGKKKKWGKGEVVE